MSTPRSAERAPDKSPDAFRTISEVAEELGLPQHVLRFWETRFSQIRPLKRGGGRRYYRPDDVDLVKGIRHLLYGEGYTIRGVQRILKDEGPRFVQAIGRGEQQVAAPPEGRVEPDREDSLGASLSSYGGTAQDSGVEDANAFMSREDAPGAMMSPDPSRSYIADADLDRLRDALAELAECVRVLDGLKLPNEPLAGE